MPTHRQERSSLSRPKKPEVLDEEEKTIKKKSYKYANIINVGTHRTATKAEDMSVNFIKSTNKELPHTSLAAAKPKAPKVPVVTTKLSEESDEGKRRQSDKSPSRKTTTKKRRWGWMEGRRLYSRIDCYPECSTNYKP